MGPCRGFEGDCADIIPQFEGVQGPYIYGEPPEEHMFLDDYVCHAFPGARALAATGALLRWIAVVSWAQLTQAARAPRPDDENYWDQILVGLISVAVALPIDMFLARAFEIANEGDAPESWLDAPAGRVKLIIGKDAHQGWHLANPSEPVSDFVLWVVRYSWEPLIASLLRLAGWLFRRWCPCCASKEANDDEAAGKHAEGEDEDEPSAAPSGASNASSAARADARSKRLYASAGLLGVYICWVR